MALSLNAQMRANNPELTELVDWQAKSGCVVRAIESALGVRATERGIEKRRSMFETPPDSYEDELSRVEEYYRWVERQNTPMGMKLQHRNLEKVKMTGNEIAEGLSDKNFIEYLVVVAIPRDGDWDNMSDPENVGLHIAHLEIGTFRGAVHWLASRSDAGSELPRLSADGIYDVFTLSFD